MITELLFRTSKVNIGINLPTATVPYPVLVQLDASIHEVYNDNSESTQHPVEDGSTVTDHIRKLPESIEITGIVSNTPIVFLASFRAPSPVTGDVDRTMDRVGAAYAQFQAFQNSGAAREIISVSKYCSAVSSVLCDVQPRLPRLI